MNNITIEKLQAKLDRNLYWRKIELTNIKTLVDSSRGQQLNTIIRAAWTLLYAHWEGYIKIAAREYLIFLNSQGLRCIDMKENFLTLAIKPSIVDVRQSNRSKKHGELVSSIFNISEMIFFVNQNDRLIVNTESNLNYETLEDIIYSLGLDLTPFDLKGQLIDKLLCENRHKIAHGEYFSPVTEHSSEVEQNKSKEQFFGIYYTVVSLMENFKDQILDACIEKRYLKSS